MVLQNIPLYDHNNGVFMIAIFVLVCVVLVGILISFMSSGKKKENND